MTRARTLSKIGSDPAIFPGNVNITGVATATTFSGAVTGNVTGNATGLTGTPNIDCGTGSFTGDVDIADKILHTGDTNTSIRFPANDTFTVETAGSERIRVDSSGKLGIGTASPTSLLDVRNESAAGNYAYFEASSDGGARGLQFSSSDNGAGLGAVHKIDATSGSYAKLILATGGTARLTMDAAGVATFSGNVISGTTPDWGNATSTGIALYPAAATNWVGIKNSSGSTATNTAFQVTYGTDTNVSFRNNGNAEFAGSVKIGGTSAANEMEEYEEGSFYALAEDASGHAQSYYEQNGQYNRGYYTKIGNIVHFTIHLYTSSAGSTVGSEGVRITGLPFTAGSGGAGVSGGVQIPHMSGMASGDSCFATGYVPDGVAYILLQTVDSNGNNTPMTITQWSAPRGSITGWYSTPQ